MRILQDSPAPAPAEDPPAADAESPEAAADSKARPADESPPPPPPGRKNLRSPPALGEAQSQSESAVWDPPRTNQISNEHIVGVGVGAGLLFFVILIICLCCRRRKKSAKRDDGKKYNPNKNAGPNYYNNRAGQKQWQTTDPNYIYMDGKKTHHQSPPQISSMTTQHWMAAPPPPPPMSGQSSAGFPGQPMPPPHPRVTWAGYNNSTFTYNDLASATDGFAEANLLGQGGFGYVHKGVLPNGKEVAVKSLKLNSGQGEREFQAEVDIISRVHHRHLVSLVGYCISGARRMLVYEYVPNSTLEDHLHGEDRPVMDCQTRIKIALGAAKGFAYLHEDCHPRIIHRDIKAANILLDNNNDAKVADFGLAKLCSENNTHISTRIMGTFGYLAPEYASTGKLTEKSDVYSFGIVLLELITGRRPVDMTRDDEDDSLVDWARPILTRVAEGGSYGELVDPRLERNYDHGEMLRLVISAAACIRQSSRKRPKMSQVVRALEGNMSLDDLQEGMKTSRSHGSLSSSSSDYDLQRYQRNGRSNVSFTSSELGAGSEVGVGSEYAHSQASGTNSNELTRPSPGDRYHGP